VIKPLESINENGIKISTIKKKGNSKNKPVIDSELNLLVKPVFDSLTNGET
jgi:hypothetical protein